MNGYPNILIHYLKDKINIVSMYVNDFFWVLNIIVTFKTLKVSLAKKYNRKNLEKVKTIIGWQIYWDFAAGIIKIDQSTFIQDLVIKGRLTNYNANAILIKANLSIEMTSPKDYKEVNLRIYYQLIEKLTYFVYGKKLDIAFAVR